MNTSTSAEIFFIISSVGFVCLWILVAICLVYAIRSLKTLSRIMKKFEHDMDSINETAEDIISDIRESFVFRFIFGKKRKSKRESH